MDILATPGLDMSINDSHKGYSVKLSKQLVGTTGYVLEGDRFFQSSILVSKKASRQGIKIICNIAAWRLKNNHDEFDSPSCARSLPLGDGVR